MERRPTQDGESAPGRGSRRWAIALAGLLFLRLAFAGLAYARPALALANDSDRYIPIANSILAGKAYGWNTDHPGELLNTIGYPLFLAGVYSLIGHEPGDVALAQLIFTGLGALVLFAVLSRWLGPKPAFLAAMLLAVDPLTILWSLTVLTEAVFAVLLGISAVLLVSWAHSQRSLTLVLAGLMCGMACLVKPYALLVVGAWTFGLILFPGLQDRGGRQLGAAFRRGALFLLPTLLLLVPWFVRNSLLWDCPTLSSVDRVTMRDYTAAKVLAEADGIGLDEAQRRLQESDPGVCPRKTTEYLGMLAQNPGTFLRLHFAGTVPVLIATSFDRWLQYLGIAYSLPDLWRPYMDGGLPGLASVIADQARDYPLAIGAMLLLTAYQLMLYVLSAAGTASALRGQVGAAKWSAAMLILAVLILILTPGQGGHERFRVPVQPLLAILIAYWASRAPALRGSGAETPARLQVT